LIVLKEVLWCLFRSCWTICVLIFLLLSPPSIILTKPKNDKGSLMITWSTLTKRLKTKIPALVGFGMNSSTLINAFVILNMNFKLLGIKMQIFQKLLIWRWPLSRRWMQRPKQQMQRTLVCVTSYWLWRKNWMM